MNERIPQMAGMTQVVMMVPTQAELDAAADSPNSQIMGVSNVRNIAGVGDAIPANRAMADNDIIRLSKNKKLRMAHRGFKAIDQTWETADRFEEVTAGSSSVWKFVAKDQRPLTQMAITDDGLVYTKGTFAETTGFKTKGLDVVNGVVTDTDIVPFTDYLYEGNASSSSANDGLVGPDVLSIFSNPTETILDFPGRTDGDAMTGENYLSQPGNMVTTSLTAKAALDLVLALVGTSNTVTTAQLIAAGIPANSVLTSKLAGYRSDLQAATPADVYDIATLQQLIVDRNHL